jgi:pyruvate-ferredoxin/flavodoxin oxidoreductase
MKTKREMATIDGNEAAARVAYRLNEVIAIYPITPATPMGEWSDQWSSEGVRNIWGTVPTVVEMQSEGGAAGAVHGALQTGSLATTFTASQGLMLMLPNMYKIAGELTPTVFHVAARSLAAQALSIFGDHSDVMAARPTGFAMLCSNSVQEAQDFALIAHSASLETRVPFIHFFDGYRTSHEVAKIELLDEDEMRAMINDDRVMEHRARALSPNHPVIRGTAQNPDVSFQTRETSNAYYLECPTAVQDAMNRFAKLTGRQYKLYEYYGAPDARQVIVIMGSGGEAVHETVDYLNEQEEKVGVLKVRLYRPFDARRFVEALPSTVRGIAVMDRTKEPGSFAEPLYLDCMAAVHESLSSNWGQLASYPVMVGGRYGLSSKEFTPAMIKAVFDNLSEPQPRSHFTVGINDDVTHTSLDYDPDFVIEPDNVFRGIFYGLGSDGTVGANKSSIKIIGEETDNYAQGYFVYDSKKSGAMTVSHLRFGPEPIRSAYLIQRPNFVACHQPVFLDRYDMLKDITNGGVFLLNTHYKPDQVWGHLPPTVRKQIADKGLSVYVIDAFKVLQQARGREGGMKQINTIMQVCFFAISGVLPREEALASIERSIRKTYARKGEEVVNMNLQAVSATLEHLHKVEIREEEPGDGRVLSNGHLALGNESAPPFVRDVLGKLIMGEGDSLPVSAMPVDGTYPTGTSRYEKRNLASEIPVWDPNVCIQCGKCAMVCPHGVIRVKVYDEEHLEGAPLTFRSTNARDKEWQTKKYTIQVSAEDCTGCGICVDICPAKNKSEVRLKAINMEPQAPLREQERDNWQFFSDLPEMDRLNIKEGSIRQQQVQQPLFEFSGACSGCGETPYIKLLTQLFGDRLVVANATGCSSIYGGNLPTTPWAHNREGRGPAWSNSLFEDNAEFGLGYRVSLDKQRDFAGELLKKLLTQVGEVLAESILNADMADEAGVHAQRERVAALKVRLEELAGAQDSSSRGDAKRLLQLADMLVRKSVWIIGGDGWAYDIGYGGLDHVLSSGRNVKVLVLDTEVYSNTGGQMSKSTPRGAIAKFAAGGKAGRKKDLGLIAMTYGNIYVASVAMGAKDEHTLKVFLEAEAYDGPALIIAYSHCIAHGIDMAKGMQNQKAAVDSGQWLLYRYNPELEEEGLNPLILDSRGPRIPVEQYMYMENRFKMLSKTRPEKAGELLKEAQQDVNTRWRLYEYLAARATSGQGVGGSEANSIGHDVTPSSPKAAILRDHVLLPSRPLRMPDGRAARGVEVSK